MAGHDDGEQVRRARQEAERIRHRAAHRAVHRPGRAGTDLPDGWSRVRSTAAQRRTARVEQVLVGPGGVVLVGDAPASIAALPDLQHERVTTCAPGQLASTLAGLPAVLDPAHVEASRVRVEAALRSLDTGFVGTRETGRGAPSPADAEVRSRVPVVLAVVATVVLLVLLALAGSHLAGQVDGLGG
jgi:hypothetical protein